MIAGIILTQGCATSAARRIAQEGTAQLAPVNAAVPFVVTNPLIVGSLNAALKAYSDPAITTTPDGHVLVSASEQTIDCFVGLVDEPKNPGAKQQISTCSFNFQVTPSGEPSSEMSSILFNALMNYANSPASASNTLVSKTTARYGSTVTIKAQDEFEMSFPGTVPQTISCHSMLPNGVKTPMIDCSLGLYTLLDASDTQAISQALENSPHYASVVNAIRKQAIADGFSIVETRIYRSMTGDLKEDTTFTAPPHEGRMGMPGIPDRRYMVINGDSVIPVTTEATQIRNIGVFYGID